MINPFSWLYNFVDGSKDLFALGFVVLEFTFVFLILAITFPKLIFPAIIIPLVYVVSVILIKEKKKKDKFITLLKGSESKW